MSVQYAFFHGVDVVLMCCCLPTLEPTGH